tara:strand:- start:39 stop:386 length:348 start_codon:yes stop_codon:yes gene_type:complete
MAHFARIENNKVVNVIVVHNNELLVDGVENEQKGKDFCHGLLGGEWVQTSYNNNIRKQYAGVGYTYDIDADQFVSPQPFASWSLDADNDWQPPTPKPEGDFYWNEETTTWIEAII